MSPSSLELGSATPGTERTACNARSAAIFKRVLSEPWMFTMSGC
jgi:hypothetical protein